MRAADAALISRWKKDPLVERMALGPGFHITPRSQREDIRKATLSFNDLYLIITVKDNDQPIGYLRVNWMDDEHRFAWLRFALGLERGKGYAREALHSLLNYLFKQGMQRAEAEVYEFNEASLRLLERLGFKREGIKRSAHFDGEVYCGVVVLGLLAPDFSRHPLDNQ